MVNLAEFELILVMRMDNHRVYWEIFVSVLIKSFIEIKTYGWVHGKLNSLVPWIGINGCTDWSQTNWCPGLCAPLGWGRRGNPSDLVLQRVWSVLFVGKCEDFILVLVHFKKENIVDCPCSLCFFVTSFQYLLFLYVVFVCLFLSLNAVPVCLFSSIIPLCML